MAPARIWLAEPNGERSFFNNSWLKFRGRSLEEESGFGWIEGIDPGDLVHLMNSYLAAVRKHEPFQLEYRILGKDGSYRWLQENGAARIDEHGNFRGYIGSCVDITEEKKATSLLNKSETRLHILDQIADGLNEGRTPQEIIAATVARLSQEFKELRVLYAAVTGENRLVVQHCCGPADLADLGRESMNLNEAPEYLDVLTGPAPIVIMDMRRPGGGLPYRNVPLVSGMRAILDMPVWHMGRICGLLSFHCAEPRFWSSHEVATIKEAASWIGLTLKHSAAGQHQQPV